MAEYRKEQEALPECEDPCSAACISKGATAGIKQVCPLVTEEERHAILFKPDLAVGGIPEEPTKYVGNIAAGPDVERLEQKVQGLCPLGIDGAEHPLSTTAARFTVLTNVDVRIAPLAQLGNEVD